MKIEKIIIQNFRSIKKLTIYIDDKLTTVVGANEHGKSTIFKAISYLDPSVDFDLNKDCRISNSAETYYPDLTFFLKIPQKEQKELIDLLNKRLLSEIDDNSKRKAIKDQIKIGDTIEYNRYIEEEEVHFYYINCGLT